MIADDLLARIAPTIASAIAIELPVLRSCKELEGRLSLEELRLLGAASPAVFVTRFGMQQSAMASGARPEFTADLVAMIVTKNAHGQLAKDHAAQVISQAIARIVPENDWNLEGLGPARDVKEQSFVTPETKSAGISLWGVTWKQPLVLLGGRDPGPVIAELYVAQAPATGDLADYDLIGGAP